LVYNFVYKIIQKTSPYVQTERQFLPPPGKGIPMSPRKRKKPSSTLLRSKIKFHLDCSLIPGVSPAPKRQRSKYQSLLRFGFLIPLN